MTLEISESVGFIHKEYPHLLRLIASRYRKGKFHAFSGFLRM